MKTIYALTDFRKCFGLKYDDKPYRSGMDKELIKRYFNEFGFNVQFINPSDINFTLNKWREKIVVYTSSEDIDLHYKSYLEDVVLGLTLAGAKVIPDFKYLRANNNKVFMEIIRDLIIPYQLSGIASSKYGTREEFEEHKTEFSYPIVIKSAEGAASLGVMLAQSAKEALLKIRKISKSTNLCNDFYELVRSYKYEGYIKQSRYRKKFIVQKFIPELDNDWKVLIFGKKYYVLKRNVRKDDFRASGSGLLSYTKDIPEGLLDYSCNIIKLLDIPQVSLDIAFHNNKLYLIELQALYFGSYTLTYSNYYYTSVKDRWECIEQPSTLEYEYATSIYEYIMNQYHYQL